MINIKNFFITSGLSLIVGFYSVYNVLGHLKIINNYHIKQINDLNQKINDSNRKFNELNENHIKLQKSYEELLINFERINSLNFTNKNTLPDQELKIDREFIDSLSLNYNCNDVSSLSNSEKSTNKFKGLEVHLYLILI